MKQPSYTRGKYKPREKPAKKRERVEGSERYYIDLGFNSYVARKMAKEFKKNDNMNLI
jgi:hypothetical protein